MGLETLQTLLLVVQIVTAVSLIGFILLQHGRGADAGAAFGSGASATVFGARGTGNFLSRTTAVLALVFLLNSLALAYIAREQLRNQTSLMDAAGAAVGNPAQTQLAPQAPTAPDIPESDVPSLPEN